MGLTKKERFDRKCDRHRRVCEVEIAVFEAIPINEEYLIIITALINILRQFMGRIETGAR